MVDENSSAPPNAIRQTDAAPSEPPQTEPPEIKDTATPGDRHIVTRFFSGLTGLIAVIAFSLFVPAYWLAQTFGSNENFTNITSSILETETVQDFVAQELSTQLTEDIANNNQLQKALGVADQAQAKAELERRITDLLKKSEAQEVLRQSTEKLYAGLFENQAAESVNLQPELKKLLQLFDDNRLGFVASQQLDERSGLIKLDGQEVEQVRNVHERFNGAWTWLLIVAIVSALASILLAPYKFKRVSVVAIWFTVISATYLGMTLLVSKTPVGGDDPKLNDALQDIMSASLGNMQQLMTILTIAFAVTAIAAHLISRRQSSQRSQIEKI